MQDNVHDRTCECCGARWTEEVTFTEYLSPDERGMRQEEVRRVVTGSRCDCRERRAVEAARTQEEARHVQVVAEVDAYMAVSQARFVAGGEPCRPDDRRLLAVYNYDTGAESLEAVADVLRACPEARYATEGGLAGVRVGPGCPLIPFQVQGR